MASTLPAGVTSPTTAADSSICSRACLRSSREGWFTMESSHQSRCTASCAVAASGPRTLTAKSKRGDSSAPWFGST